jgi:hypothetical protein
MSAEDELALPQVPEERPEDPEDVSWALSTAEAMWARGDHLEGIKWVRKAAEAASDAEDDERALELAKAASELTTLVARRSRASIGDGPGLAGGAPPEMQPMSAPQASYVPQSQSMQPQSGMPHSAPPQSMQPRSVPVSVHPPSAPPPQTSRMGNAPSMPPPAPLAPPMQAAMGPAPMSAPQPVPVTAVSAAASRPLVGKSVAPARSVAPAPIPLPSRASSAPRAPASQAPQAPRATGSSPAPKAKSKRRSRENMDAEAREVAGLLDTAPQTAIDGPSADRALDRTYGDEPPDVGAVEMPVQNARVKRRSNRAEPEATVVTNLDELTRAQLAQHRERAAQEWDASTTQNLSGDEMDHMSYGDRKTAMSVPLPPPMVVPPPVRPPSSTVHDPEIQTSQAVRVVVWRDGNGVHVAPAGTVVSSITIDAVLVVLEPGVDLTAWLSQRGT